MKRSISSIRPWPKNGEERERRNESFPNTVVNSALTPIFVRAIRGWSLEGEGEGVFVSNNRRFISSPSYTPVSTSPVRSLAQNW